MYAAYVLFSGKLKKRYVGSAEDPYLRLDQHNKGRSHFTSRGIPWKLSYVEYYQSHKEAMNRERFLKTGAGRIFLNRVLELAQGYPQKEIPDNCLRHETL